MSRRRLGLTLIELIVVMAIIAFLSAFFIVHLAGPARMNARRAATIGVVKQVELAIASYKTQFAALPPDLPSLLTTRTKTIVSGDPSDPRCTQTLTFGPFLVLAKEYISQDGKEILDAWGDPIHYDPRRTQGLVWSDNVNDP